LRGAVFSGVDGGELVQWGDICVGVVVVSQSEVQVKEKEAQMLRYSKPSEIAKRTAVFMAVGQVGSMFAGVMMTAMHKTMEGRGGLKGWQWVFLIGTLM
jgi:hypothetical protein